MNIYAKISEMTCVDIVRSMTEVTELGYSKISGSVTYLYEKYGHEMTVILLIQYICQTTERFLALYDMTLI